MQKKNCSFKCSVVSFQNLLKACFNNRFIAHCLLLFKSSKFCFKMLKKFFCELNLYEKSFFYKLNEWTASEVERYERVQNMNKQHQFLWDLLWNIFIRKDGKIAEGVWVLLGEKHWCRRRKCKGFISSKTVSRFQRPHVWILKFCMIQDNVRKNQGGGQEVQKKIGLLLEYYYVIRIL